MKKVKLQFTMPKKAVWESLDPRTNEWGRYDPEDSARLEASFKGKKTVVSLDFCGSTFEVDVKKMVQKNSSGGSRTVRRTEVDEAAMASSSSCRSFIRRARIPASRFGSTLDAGRMSAAAPPPPRSPSLSSPPLFEALKVDLATVDAFIFCYLLDCKGCWMITKQELAAGLSATRHHVS